MPETELDELRQQLREISQEVKAVLSRQDALEKFNRETIELLRGRGDGMGIVGQVQVLWRSWVVIVGMVGMAAGFVLKTVMG